MSLVIVDYNAGNLRSVQRACAEVGHEAVISADSRTVAQAERIIFPGVGAAGSAMDALRARGLDRALLDAYASGTPILGICLGLQISLAHSEENDTTTLGLIPGAVCRFALDDPQLKVPHMGWNAVNVVRAHPVLEGIRPGDEFYFVHAYFTEPSDESSILARTDYEISFVSALAKNNYVGTQFHPEKSGRAGLGLLSRFADWDGRPC